MDFPPLWRYSMSRKLARLYSETKTNRRADHYQLIYGKDNTLFSSGIYPTKITPGDLPEWYVYGRFYKHWGYLSALGVKSLVYEPNKFSNHMFKDDFLYISYNEPILPNPDRSTSFYKYIGFDEYIYGGVIVSFLKAAEIYSGYDISEIKKQIEEKRLWFKDTYPDDYALEVSSDKPYFYELGDHESL